MLARVVRALMMVVACSGLWAALLRIEPRLWTQPLWQSREAWTLRAKADGQMAWGATRQNPYGERRVGLDGRTWAGAENEVVMPAWVWVSTTAPATTPIDPVGPHVMQVAPAGLRWEPSGLENFGSQPDSRESWFLVTDDTRRRFYLVAYRVDQCRPVVWFARDGFRGSPPPAGAWFSATCEPAESCRVTLPDPRLRRLRGIAADWPQPVSLLLLADGGLLSVDIHQRRQRVLLPPCGLDSLYESQACQFDVDYTAKGDQQRTEMPHRPVAARAGDLLFLIDRHQGTTRRLRLPSALRGRPLLYGEWPDGAVAAIDCPPVHTGGFITYGGVCSQPDGVPRQPLTAVVTRPDGRVVKQQRIDFSPLVRYPVRRRALLVAACPLGLIWPGPARLDDAGVAQGWRWALWLQLLLALTVYARTRRGDDALLTLVLGLPGWLAWRLGPRGEGRPRHARRPDWSRRRSGVGALGRLYAKDLRRLWPGLLLAGTVVVSVEWTQGAAELMATIRGGYFGSDGYGGCFNPVPGALAWVAVAWAGWVLCLLLADERWNWLLTRPVRRGQALAAKLAAGLTGSLVLVGLIFVLPAVLAFWPGACAGPITWPMLAPLASLAIKVLAAWLLAAGVGVGVLAASGRLPRVLPVWVGLPLGAAGEVLAAALALGLVTAQPLRGPGDPPSPQVEESGTRSTDNLDVTNEGVEPAVGVIVNVLDQLILDQVVGPRMSERYGIGRVDHKAPQLTFQALPRPTTTTPQAKPVAGGIRRLLPDERAVWYLVFGERDPRRYCFLAYDRNTWRCLGWLSRRGHTRHRPAEDDTFDTADGGFDTDQHSGIREFYVADGQRVRRLALGLGAGEVMAEGAKLLAFRQDTELGAICVYSDHLVLGATDKLPRAELRLRPEWHDLAWVARRPRGGLVISDPTYRVDNARRLLWVSPDGQVTRSVTVDRHSGRRGHEKHGEG